MIPNFPVALFVFGFLVFLLLIWFDCQLRMEILAFEAFTLTSVFSSIIIGFIIVFAMQKYDDYMFRARSTLAQISQLRRYLRQYRPELEGVLEDYLQSHCQRQANDYLLQIEEGLLPVLPSPAVHARVVKALAVLDENSTRLLLGYDQVPPVIWWVVFISITILSCLIVLDQKLSSWMATGVLVIIWLPITVIYYLYATRENIFARYLKKNF